MSKTHPEAPGYREMEERNPETIFLKKAFSEYLQANVRFPQEISNRISGFFVLESFVSVYPNCTDEVITKLSQFVHENYSLTTEQVEQTYKVAQAVHAKYDIHPARYIATPTADEKEKQEKEEQFKRQLHRIWLGAIAKMYKSANSFRLGILDAFQKNGESQTTVTEKSSEEEQWRFCWPYIITITQAMIDILNSEESKSLAKRYREAHQQKKYTTGIANEHADYTQSELTRRLAVIYPGLDFSYLFADLNSWEYPD